MIAFDWLFDCGDLGHQQGFVTGSVEREDYGKIHVTVRAAAIYLPGLSHPYSVLKGLMPSVIIDLQEEIERRWQAAQASLSESAV